LATAGGNGIAKVWDAETGEELLAFTRHTSGLASIMYSPDGRLIATSSDQPDGTARVWDAQTGEQYLVLEGGGVMMWKLAFSPDSSLLVTGSDGGGASLLVTGNDGGGARVWDIASGNQLYATSHEPEFIPDVAFTPDGQFFVTAGSSLRVWRTEDGEEVLTLTNDLIWWFTISPDGRYIYATDFREVLRVFTLQLDDTIALAHERLTRWWRPEECQRYLHTDECPPAPPKFSSNP
jgi:WD40 repeat protein